MKKKISDSPHIVSLGSKSKNMLTNLKEVIVH